MSDLVDRHEAEESSITIKPFVDPEKKIYACKIFKFKHLSESDLLRALNEIKINDMLHSLYAPKHYQTIKTSYRIYMIQEQTNDVDLQTLLRVRGTLR